MFSKFAKDFGSNGAGNDCLAVDGLLGYWLDRNCSERFSFVCEQRINVMRGVSLKNLTFNQNELDLSSIVIGYRYQAAKKDVLDAWEDKRVTGFKVNWFIQDSNGTRMTEELPARTEDWKSIQMSSTYGSDELLNKSVQLATQW